MLRKANVELTQIMIIDKFLIHRTIVCLVPIGRNDLWIAISLALKSSFISQWESPHTVINSGGIVKSQELSIINKPRMAFDKHR